MVKVSYEDREGYIILVDIKRNLEVQKFGGWNGRTSDIVEDEDENGDRDGINLQPSCPIGRKAMAT
jgi:hypothetical protein